MVLAGRVTGFATEVGVSSRAEMVAHANILEVSLLESVPPMIDGKGRTVFLS